MALDKAFIEDISGEQTCLRIRLLSPLGRYPNSDVMTDQALLIVRDDVVFSVVIVQPKASHGLSHEYHSEVEIFSIEELRFYACLSLSVHPEAGMVYTYPSPYYIDLPLIRRGLGSSTLLSTNDLLAKAREYAAELRRLPQIDRQAKVSLQSLYHEDLVFERHEHAFDVELFCRLLTGASTADWLVTRGLGALFRGDMVWQHLEFAELGVISMHIAMEASFQMIRERLKCDGNPDPSALDAGVWLDSVFNPTIETGKYFANWYEVRIKTIHPSSRFGTYPYPPLATDDFYDLRSALHLVYVYLLIGENISLREEAQ